MDGRERSAMADDMDGVMNAHAMFPTDASLVARLAAGEADALGPLYRKYGPHRTERRADAAPLVPGEVIRATPEEKQAQIDGLAGLHAAHGAQTERALQGVRSTAVEHGNLFAELMSAVKSCSLGQLTEAMFEVGGAYRRNM